MDASLAVAVLSLAASAVALNAATIAVIAAKRFRSAAKTADVRLDRITHQLAALDQAWYWTPEWQAGEAEADADSAAGRSTRYDSDEEFLASLRNIPAADRPARAR